MLFFQNPQTAEHHLNSLKNHNTGPNCGFPCGSDGACNAEDPGSIPGLGRSPGEGYGYPLQYSHLENSMGRGAWRATLNGIAKSQTRLSE